MVWLEANLTVNGKHLSLKIPKNMTPLEFLRNQL